MESESVKKLEGQASKKNNEAIQFVLLLIVIGVISILIYAIKALWWNTYTSSSVTNGNIVTITNTTTTAATNFQSVIYCFSLGILIAGSAHAFGSLIGFIFAIPKQIKNATGNFIKSGQGYVSNDNLVEVSDWLTKIIVGVSLTQLMSVPHYLQSLGEYVGKAIGGSETGEVAAESIVVYFLICGFLLSYLWTRLYFARMLEDAENGEGLIQ